MWGGVVRKALLALAACGLLAAHAAPSLAANPYPRKGDSDPHDGVIAAKRMPVQGIDVARYQLDIDWREVKRAGTRFAFIKATEGGDMLDPKFRENWTESKEAGVPRGAYHFVFWCRPAKDQIRWFIRNVPKEPDALPPVLDVEWNHKSSCRKPSPEKARAKMREMLRAFEAHYGKKPIIYTDITFHEDVLDGTREFDDYPFWVRSVADRPKERYGDRPWEFWQFTATGRVPGIKGDVDRNAFFGTEKQFRDWVEGRFDIGTRQPIAAPATRLAKEPVRPRQEPADARPARALAYSSDDRDDEEEPPRRVPPRVEPTPEPVRRAPVRPEMRRSDPNRPVPPGVVPDVTGSIRR
ncbi:MAG: GH25 family lysozyme [Beijerinckiaceae bacterium]